MNEPANRQLADSLHEVGEALHATGAAAAHLEHAAEEAVEQGLRRHPRWRIAVRAVFWLLMALYLLFAVVFLGLRYWVLPRIGQYTPDVESSLTRVVGETVSIGSMSAGWDGLRPELHITRFEVRDSAGQVALSLPAVDAVVAWSTLVYGAIQFHSLTFDGPDLALRRDAQGRLYVAGLPLKTGGTGPGMSDWLLTQHEIAVRDAHLSWTDEQRGAPALELSGVNLLLENSGSQHRFALRALTSRELASALDVRGDLRGTSLDRLQQWTGELYAKLDYTDLAAWQRWIDYPFELGSGNGGVRLWLGVADGRLVSFTADVALAHVATRLGSDLPQLDLDYLYGRLGARNSTTATEVFGKGVTLANSRGLAMAPTDFALRVEPGLKVLALTAASNGNGGTVMAPGGGAQPQVAATATQGEATPAHSEATPAQGGATPAQGAGAPATNITAATSAPGASTPAPSAAAADVDRKITLTASGLELEPLARLAEFLPLPEDARQRLAEAAPRCRFDDLALNWSGSAAHPSAYAMQGRFSGLGMRAAGKMPGFAGLSGSVDATQKGGQVVLDSATAQPSNVAQPTNTSQPTNTPQPRSPVQPSSATRPDARLASPGTASQASVAAEVTEFDVPDFLPTPVRFDTLSGKFKWAFRNDQLELHIGDLNFANADAAGTITADYANRPDSPGLLDLTASLSRANATATWRYIPHLRPSIQDYLKRSVLAGTSNSVRIKLRGDLGLFPFADARAGTFQVTARINDGAFIYADGWPQADALNGDIEFESRGMRVTAQRASILGANVSNVKAEVADLYGHNPMVSVDGMADGSTQEFLHFIDVSPLTRILGGATGDMQAAGNGRLQVRLDLPLSNPEKVRVSGSYVVQNNQLLLGPDIPVITQANGRLNFTADGINARGVLGQFLGGPVSLSVQTRSDGAVAVAAQGTASIAGLRRYYDSPLLAQASGAAPWRGAVVVQKHQFDLNVDSTLQGIAIDLPAPLGKAAADAMPLRIERDAEGDGQVQQRFPGLKVAPHGDAIYFSLGKVANVLLLRRPDAAGKSLQIERGVLALNAAATLPEQPGLALTGSLPYLDADRWQVLMSGDKAGAPAQAVVPAAPAAPATPAAVPAVSPVAGAAQALVQSLTPSPPPGLPAQPAVAVPLPALTAINLRAGTLDAAGKRFNDVTAQLSASPAGVWSGSVSARELAGDVSWNPEQRGKMMARLKRLTIPEDRPDQPPAAQRGQSGAQSLQRELPALDIVADDFTLRDRQFGKLELSATNEVRDWRIDRLVLSSSDAVLSADGTWQTWAARPSISLNFKLAVNDAGKFMDRMGFPQTMQAGTAKLEGKVGWAGGPQSVDYSTMTGSVRLSADKGRFLKANPGVAKLIGVLSLQSLVTFDLRDLFREGFAYESIGATADIAKGVLSTADFRMNGAPGLVTISGTADMARETQNLHVRVVPSLGAGASTVAALVLANPALGIIASLANKILKDPLGQIFALEYNVTGPWSDPKVDRTKVEAPSTKADSPSAG